MSSGSNGKGLVSSPPLEPQPVTGGLLFLYDDVECSCQASRHQLASLACCIVDGAPQLDSGALAGLGDS